MHHVAWLVVVVAACETRSFSSSDQVRDLSTGEQETLCEDFLDDICAGELGEFCDDPCIDSGCRPAAESGNIDTECDGISVGMVDDCAASSSAEVCLAGGGCMFDALEALCP
ncbi:MAG: hypothetical protein ACKV2T_30785 [Kofleriaceae bacterium]